MALHKCSIYVYLISADASSPRVLTFASNLSIAVRMKRFLSYDPHSRSFNRRKLDIFFFVGIEKRKAATCQERTKSGERDVEDR